MWIILNKGKVTKLVNFLRIYFSGNFGVKIENGKILKVKVIVYK